MADDRIFTLVGKFDDKITPSLAKLSKSISGLTRDFDKLKRNLRPIAKDMAIMAEGANRISDGFKNQRSSIDTAVRGLTEYRRELGKAASAQQKLSRKVSLPTFDGGGGGRGPSRPSRGRSGRPAPSADYGGMGDGYTIDKGIIAGLATEFITGIFTQITGAVGKSIGFVKNALQERIADEMGDIQSAGGILSIGKEKKVAWADTFQEAMGIQNKLNSEMANLAAALPGETEQYVANMKQVTDTTMKVVQSNGPAMIKAMQGFNGSVVTQKDAYIEATKQLAKYTTLASIGNEGGMPLTALAEQMLNADKVNVGSLKNKFAALKKNPLVSGALEKYEKEMNKGAAGSAERYTAMIKAFEQAFPAEVLDAMTNSADGIIQGMKSSIFNPDIGLLGLGRKMKVSFAGLNRQMGPAMEELSVFDMFLKIFKAFGMVVSPILAELPKIIEVMDPLISPLKDFFVKAENTISNFKGATKMFGDMNLSFPAFRASLLSIGKLAKSMGGDEKEFGKLEKMLTSGNLNLGQALQQAFKVLFSSNALKEFGQAIGKALGSFLSMLAGLATKGGSMVDQSGLMSGFLKGWQDSGGTKAIMELVKTIITTVVKALVGATADIVRTDPISAALIGTIFIAPIRNAVLGMLKNMGKNISGSVSSAGRGLGGGMADDVVGGGAGQMGNMFAGRRGKAYGRLMRMKGRGVAGAAGSAMAAGYGGMGKPGMRLFTKLEGTVGRLGKYVGKGNIAMGAVDAALRMASGESAGSAIGGAAATTIGSVIGGTLGSALGPIGTMIGATAGGMIGDKLFTVVSSSFGQNAADQRIAAAMQLQAAAQQKQASQLTKGGGDQTFLYGEGANLSKRLDEMGAGASKAAQSFKYFYTLREANAKSAALAADTLNTKINELRQQGIPPDLIAKMVKPLQVQADTEAAKLKASQDKLRSAFEKLPASLQDALVKNVSNMPMSAVESAWANKINGLSLDMTGSINIGSGQIPGMFPGGKPPTPGAKPTFSMLPGAKKGAAPTPAPKAAAPKYNLGGVFHNADGSPGQKHGSLGSAIASELANKPSGSSLVIANSSETIIPAAGGSPGASMDALISATYGAASRTASAFQSGFQSFGQKVLTGQMQTTAMLKTISMQNTALMTKMTAVAAAGGLGGSKAGGGAPMAGGNIVAVGKQLLARGLQVGMNPNFQYGKGFLPQGGGYIGKHAPNSYHYSGRALDVSGSNAQLDAAYASLKGTNPKELIWRAPGHYDHLHVAYAMGSGNPAFFNSASSADKWESMMAGKSPIVSSVRAQAHEMKGGTMTVNAPITIHQQPGQDSDQLASLVAIKLTQAVNQLRYSSYNV